MKNDTKTYTTREDFNLVIEIAEKIARPYKVAMYIFALGFLICLGVISYMYLEGGVEEVNFMTDRTHHSEVTQWMN